MTGGRRVYRLAFKAPRTPLSVIVLAPTMLVLLLSRHVAEVATILLLWAFDSLLLVDLRVSRRMALLLVVYTVLTLPVVLGLKCSAAAPTLLGSMLWYGLSNSLYGFAVRVAVGLALLALLNPYCCLAYSIGLAVFASVQLVLVVRGASPRLALAYTLSWIDRYDELEEIALEKGCRVPVRTTILEYVDVDGRVFRLAIPEVHYGPFRRAGGATLPYMLKDKGFLPLHPPVTHDRNPCSVRDALGIVELAVDEASRRVDGFPSYLLASDKTYILPGGYRARVFPAPLPLIVVDRPRHGIDDPEVSFKTPLLLVDAHNEETQGNPPPLPESISSIASDLSATPAETCLIGYAEKIIDGHESLGLCGNWVSALTLKCGSKPVTLLIIPSNNAEHGLRARVELLLSPVTKPILVTIDDHKCVGAKPGVVELKATSSPRLINTVVEVSLLSLKDLRVVDSVSARIVESNTCLWCSLYRETRRLEKLWVTGYLSLASLAVPYAVEIVLHLLRGF